MNLQALKRIAVDAGGLVWEVDPQQFRRIVASDGRPCLGVVGGGHVQPYTETEMMSIATHVTTFSPAAVIELIARLEEAEFIVAACEKKGYPEATCL